jgi:hypothetical protein
MKYLILVGVILTIAGMNFLGWVLAKTASKPNPEINPEINPETRKSL